MFPLPLLELSRRDNGPTYERFHCRRGLGEGVFQPGDGSENLAETNEKVSRCLDSYVDFIGKAASITTPICEWESVAWWTGIYYCTQTVQLVTSFSQSYKS